MKTHWRAGWLAAAILAIAGSTASIAWARRASAVVMTNAGITPPSTFCTSTGNITVVHRGTQDANGHYAFGSTLLTGPATYRLGPGNARVAKGCYTHTIANTTVVGSARVQSTVWYDE
jgi:hypothetical protein